MITQIPPLWQATKRLTSQATVNDTVRETLAISLDLTAAQYGSISLFDKRSEQLTLHTLIGHPQPTATRTIPDGEHILNWVATTKKPLRLANVTESPWTTSPYPHLVTYPIQSVLVVPLLGSGEELEGVLTVESLHPNRFAEEDQQALTLLASHAVQALQETRLLEALHRIFDSLSDEPETLFNVVIDWACDLINVAAGTVWLVEEGDLVCQLSRAGYKAGQRFPFAGSLAQQAICLRQPVTIDDTRSHPNYDQRYIVSQNGWVSLIVVPLIMPHQQGTAFGSVSFFARHLRDFSNRDRRVLICLANHVAIALQQARQLSQLQQARERQAMAETFAAMGDLGANLIHQLNNKVGAIPAKVQAIEAKSAAAVKEDAYLARSLRAIENNARRALAIVRESMDLLRPTTPHPVEIAPCLAQALQRARPVPQVTIRQHGLTDLPPVIATAPQLEMLFYNLIDNALKASSAQGLLEIWGEVQGDLICLTVQDNGRGIDEQIRPRLFDFGSRANSNGLGFGLWWAKAFVERFGGFVRVESRPQGTRINIYLPIGTYEA